MKYEGLDGYENCCNKLCDTVKYVECYLVSNLIEENKSLRALKKSMRK